MRKIIVITTIIILTLALTGCGNGKLTSKPNKKSPKTPAQADSNTNQSPNTEESAAKQADSSTSNQTTGGTSIIAKSENNMSSSDKEELLNQVDKELDSLFSNINNLEDTQDADLDLNQK